MSEIVWHEHDGVSDPPIKGRAKVQVMFRDETFGVGRWDDWDQNWQWAGSVEGEIADGAIVAYRILKPSPNQNNR